MEFEQIITLIKTVSDSKVTSFTYVDESIQEKITIKKEGEQVSAMPLVSVSPQMPVVSQMPVVPQMPVMPQMPVVQSTAETEVSTAGDEGVKTVTSPLVGTFYSAASPEDEPFVKVGDRVQKGQKLGIIEAMKLMNDIESDYDGEIVEILVSNENMVEYGQPLFKIK